MLTSVAHGHHLCLTSGTGMYAALIFESTTSATSAWGCADLLTPAAARELGPGPVPRPEEPCHRSDTCGA